MMCAMKHRLFKIAAIVISSIVSFAVAELALRSLREPKVLSSEWRFIKPHALSRDLITIDPRFLDEGFYASFQGPGAPLIVALGDSYTAGYNVGTCLDPREPCGSDNSYPAQLRTKLEAAGVDARLMNAGVGDTGSGQQLRLLEEYVLPRVDPQVVVWQFYANDLIGNAIMPVYTISDGNALEPLDAGDVWLYKRQRLFEGIPLKRDWKRASRLVQLLMDPYESHKADFVPADRLSDQSLWGLEKLHLQVAAMNQLAAEHGFAIYYVLIPAQTVYLAETGEAVWTDHWLTKDHERIRDELKGQPTFLDLDSELGAGDEFFDAGDGAPGGRHLSIGGYERVATKVAERLLADGAVAPE